MNGDVEDLQPPSSTCVKQRQAYPPALRKLYYSLLTKRIPAAKVADIVKTVSTCVKQRQAYPPALRKLYCSLLTKQISAAKVADIVKTVSKTFHPSLDTESLSLPKKACASYMRKDKLVTVCSAQKATLLCKAAASASGFRMVPQKIKKKLIVSL